MYPLALAAGNDAPLRGLEDHGRGRHIVTQHLALEATLAPGPIEWQSEVASQGFDIRACGGPVHEGPPCPIHLVMPELDAFGWSTGFQQGEQTGRAVLAARHGTMMWS
ncbi:MULTISPECIES: hypothetical protein [unclassified Gluconobacter]|uniref:hypothetical protein n=1 Tax=unclassified Gluconobacter TaxID=2644261 RepID=UPI001E5ACAE7|nr:MULTISPECIES: hypothetical protein [unclassified Gluconobacter]